MVPSVYYRRANLSLLLEVECIDFLEFSFLVESERATMACRLDGWSYQSEEEGRLICLQGSLRVKGLGGIWCSILCSILGKEVWCSAQLLNELLQRQWRRPHF